MKRRAFLRPVAASRRVAAPALPGFLSVQASAYANQALPAPLSTTAALDAYAGPWGPDQAAHLLLLAN